MTETSLSADGHHHRMLTAIIVSQLLDVMWTHILAIADHRKAPPKTGQKRPLRESD